MRSATITKFSDLPTSDLVVDAVYEGGQNKNVSDDPLSKLMGCGNAGGFRLVGSIKDKQYKFCVLYSDMVNHEWPDHIEIETGRFIYYGDNRTAGRDLHDTPKKGNVLLRTVFDRLHLNDRLNIPPFFIFTKGEKGRDITFRGLAVPGAEDINDAEDLVAIWKLADGRRFQNYKSTFTILDIPVISRAWIYDLHAGNPFTENAPQAWKRWVKTGDYLPLKAERSLEHRTKLEQIPSSPERVQIIQSVIDFFKNHREREYAFEKCAAELAKMMDNNIVSLNLTRFWQDGGRDATGKYRIGMNENNILVDFALEAKCKQLTSGSGVRETSRLISRLRHRQFGLFITTSFVNDQAYKEIKEDGHPVVIICAEDIVSILEQRGLRSSSAVQAWLEAKFV